MPYVIQNDTDNTKNWTYISDYFDEFGVLVSREIQFDNGLNRSYNFTGDATPDYIQYDYSTDGSLYAWEFISMEYYADGTLNYKVERMDDGSEKNFLYREDGSLSLVNFADNGAGAFNFFTQDISYDLFGNMEWRETQLLNGVERRETFENGVRNYTIEVDQRPAGDPNGEAWMAREYTYDYTGELAMRQIYFDNGIEQRDTWQNGFLQTTFQHDQSTDGSAARWIAIDTQYHMFSNQRAQVETWFDNGIYERQTFDEQGYRQSTLKVDEGPGENGTQAWTAIETNYGFAGELLEQVIYRDDNVTVTNSYQGGTRLQRTMVDESLDGTAKNWAAIVTDYDPTTGERASSQTYFDDGREKTVNFQNGQVTDMFIFDAGDGTGAGAYNWTAQITEFDQNGQRDLYAIQYDNGDERIVDYTDGVRSLRWEYDGGGEQAWAYRVVTYVDGQATVETFDSFEELPEAYRIYTDYAVAV